MYSLAVIVDNQNHRSISDYFKQNCTKIAINEVPLNQVVGNNVSTNFSHRLRIANKIKQWVKENNHQAVLILSDYNFAYRMLVHYCRNNKKSIFLYQDGFIFFEPWSKNIKGYLKRLIYQGSKVLRLDHFISYQSFHTNPNLVLSWGDFFTRTFRLTTSSDVLTLGSTIYSKNYKSHSVKKFKSNKILYYGTFYRDFEKDVLVKKEAIDVLKKILSLEEDLICDIKLHPLDKNRIYLEQFVRNNSLNSKINLLSNDFTLAENIDNYRIIISDFSTETIFASLIHQNIFFAKTSLNKKHFKSLNDFLEKKRIGDNDYYSIDRTQLERFQSEYFQPFNIDLFEKTIQKYN